MPEPAYVSIAGTYARRIRGGELPPGTQLPSYAEIVQRHGVSEIVARKAVELLQSQGLVRSVRRRGVFVADRLPTQTHADWLHTTPGDIVKTVHQRFFAADGRLIMRSDVSYPRDRYDAFLFRMTFSQECPETNGE